MRVPPPPPPPVDQAFVVSVSCLCQYIAVLLLYKANDLSTTQRQFSLWLLRGCASIVLSSSISMIRTTGPQLKVSSDTVTLTRRRGSNSGPLGTCRVHHAGCFLMSVVVFLSINQSWLDGFIFVVSCQGRPEGSPTVYCQSLYL